MKSPRTGYHDSLKNIQLTKNQVLRLYPQRAQYYPPSDSTQITWGLGGYTHRVRSRAPSGELTPTKSKHPPGDSAQTTQGLRGYCREPNTGVPKEMELNNHRTLKTPERTRAPLRFLPERREFWFRLTRCPSARGPSAGSAFPDGWGTAPPRPRAEG